MSTRAELYFGYGIEATEEVTERLAIRHALEQGMTPSEITNVDKVVDDFILDDHPMPDGFVYCYSGLVGDNAVLANPATITENNLYSVNSYNYANESDKARLEAFLGGAGIEAEVRPMLFAAYC